MKVPFNRPPILRTTAFCFDEAFKNNKLSDGGPLGKQCEASLNHLNKSKNLVVHSATSALEMMALLLEIGPEDEVIVPSFTYVSTANAFCLRGAKILFADNDDNGNILPSEIERLATPKTKACCVVHYGGYSANITQIQKICEEKSILILEDSAQCIGSSFKNRALGTFGVFGCYSFHETKNITSGEGGCLIINDDFYLQKARDLRNKGTNKDAFLSGATPLYEWQALGSSYGLADLNAALLNEQLKYFERIQSKRQIIWETYYEVLHNDLERVGFKIIQPGPHNSNNFHMFAIVADQTTHQNSILEKLSQKGVQATSHFFPLHLSKYGQKYKKDSLPKCESLYKRLFRLPLWYNMEEKHYLYAAEQLQALIKLY